LGIGILSTEGRFYNFRVVALCLRQRLEIVQILEYVGAGESLQMKI
jgi:hypothetical protein